MNRIVVAGVQNVTCANLRGARLGVRFGRLDRMSQLAVLAVEPLRGHFEEISRDRIGIVLSSRAGSVSTDVEYWEGRARAGGPSPTLFAYTLPSSAIGEIAIRHGLRGPNLCFVGGEEWVVAEGVDLIWRGEADGCLCLVCDVITPAAGRLMGEEAPAARVRALFLKPGDSGLVLTEENSRDTKMVWRLSSEGKPAI